MKPLHLFSSVWGDHYIDWMDRALVRSLSWPKNKEALHGAVWHIYTKKLEQEKVLRICDKVGIPIIFHDIPQWIIGSPPNMGLILLKALLDRIRDCLTQNAQLMMAPPDTIFSEGSVANMRQLARFGGCVAVPHARVTPKIFDVLGDKPMSGNEMVSNIFKYPHKSWEYSEVGLPHQSTHIGGIAWEKVDDVYVVQHMLPTIYLANFVENDYEFFTKSHDGTEPVYGAWDHLWPMKLVKEERQRTPGSSDVACMVEVTREDQNVPALVPVSTDVPDSFWRGALHNQHNRQIYYVMR